MKTTVSQGECREELVGLFEAMYAELSAWRALHPDASLDEIAAQVTPRRRRVMGAVIAQLACHEGNGVTVDGKLCPRCGERMKYKGEAACSKEHLEGEITLQRAYYVCPVCGETFFPPR